MAFHPLRFSTALVVPFLAATAAQAEFTLNILHTNDIHSRVESINRFDSTCDAEGEAENKCFGGVARIATKVTELRDAIEAAGGNVIVLDAGDPFQGSMFYTTYKGAAEAEFMAKIGYDAMAVGNHEFDDGPAALAAFVDAVNFPVVSGNLDLSGSAQLRDRIQNYVVLDVGAERVGIVSALATDTAETSSPGPDVIFQDEIAALRADVAELEAMGVNKIIALTHVGLPKDVAIAQAVPGIDAIVGGHSHTFLSASDPDRTGAYPTFVSQDDGTLVPVVQAYAYSKYLGHLELTFSDSGELLYAGGDAIVLDASVAPDSAIAARVSELGGPIEEIKQTVVAQSSDVIEGSREVCRAMECPMGNLVADAMLDRVKDQGVVVAIQNGGGLRASIDDGEVTMGEVLTVLPFQNTLATFTATGEMIVEALENGVSQIDELKGRFPQVAGLRFEFDAAAPVGERISNVLISDGNGGFAPIDPAREYGAVTNNYVRNGGDGYRMFASASDAYDFGPGLEVVVAEYLAASGPYQPYTDGRITAK